MFLNKQKKTLDLGQTVTISTPCISLSFTHMYSVLFILTFIRLLTSA